jgi:ribosomal protein S18 acetylase RimI-like enzyme
MYITPVTTASNELWEALLRLVPQLTANNPPPSREDLTALVNSESSTLLIARHPDATSTIVGAACLTVYRVPTGIRAIIEDVIVDEKARGEGIGQGLVRRCLEIAKGKGAHKVALTSNPSREAANQLYVKMGFIRRNTNSYIYDLSSLRK